MVEKLRLKEEGQGPLAEKVCWVSEEQGDGLGYDIQSYQKDGQPLFIEVKTTNGGILSSFYLSTNELEVARELGANYVLYRVFDFSENPKIYKLFSPLENHLKGAPFIFCFIGLLIQVDVKQQHGVQHHRVA